MLAWGSILLEYTNRQPTFPSDRLAGLVGISQELGRIWGDQYFYGFWSKDSIGQVAWNAHKRSYRISGFPTWSWASVDSPITFAFIQRYEYQIVAFIESTPLKCDADSSKSGPMLALRGKVMKPSAICSTSIASSQVATTLVLDVADEDPDLQADESVCYLMLGYSYWHHTIDALAEGSCKPITKMKLWFLIFRKADEGVYTRVGIATHVFVENVLLRRQSQLCKKLKAQPREIIRLI
ncbi:hypothetical protein CLAIMM_12198 isoform 2 [Cladophialophora immunda]|nr:hypothetical protein CLAIMM_12198 isoform 2 [Cladophialophora immunda]